MPEPTSSPEAEPTEADGGATPDGAPGAGNPRSPSGAVIPETGSEPDTAPIQDPAPIPQPVPVGPAPDRPAPTPPVLDALGFLGSVVTDAVGNVGLIVRPEAAIAVATEFTFPMALAIAVLLFIVAQDQVDRRDPKLRAAPQHQADTLIRFEAEEQL